MTISIKDLLNETLNISEEAGALLLTFFRDKNEHYSKDEELIPNDFATEADLASEQLIIKRLKALRPNDIYVAEEGTGSEVKLDKNVKAGTLIWHIDPLDGTVNFSRGVEFFAVSIAAVDAITGKTVLGVVYAPAIKRTFFSYEEFSYVQEADGDIELLKTARYSTAHLLALGFAYESEERSLLSHSLPELLENFGDMRHFGSCALNLCFLAEGRVDAYVETYSKTWDFMAGELIARNAGIIVEAIPNTRMGGFSLAAAKTKDDFQTIKETLASLKD